jgi:uncharacterized membrane protein
VTCPLSGCQTALTSSYSTLLGVPLSAYGAAVYGLVAALAWWGAGLAGDEEEAGLYTSPQSSNHPLHFISLISAGLYLLLNHSNATRQPGRSELAQLRLES